MPHKHTRAPASRTDKDFDLAPSQRARPLSAKSKTPGATAGKKRKRSGADDDTPAAFKRLLAKQAHLQSRPRGSASNSTPFDRSESKPGAKKTSTAAVPNTSEPKKPSGLSDPSPLLPRAAAAVPNRGTRLQRKIEKKVSAWRLNDARQRERRRADAASAREQAEERVAKLLERSGIAGGMEDEEILRDVGLGYEDDYEEDEREKKVVAGKKKRKTKEEDDFAVLKEKRGPPPKLGDVAKAPPELKKVREVFRDKKNKDAAGLKHAADLGEARLEVIRRYREMMGREGGL
ncbi:hypothetical protein ANO11243_086880 [Dothideomycetidae sp. 11243]|nr:hypothetical protein ANO11243_086880 [fungal sp. No.11243]